MRLRNFFFGFATTVLVFYVLIVGKNLLIPLVLAFFIWYVINALADAFRRIPKLGPRLPGGVALAFAIFAILGVLNLFVNLISSNVTQIVEVAPTYEKNLSTLAERFYTFVDLEEPPSLATLLERFDLEVVITRTASALGNFLGNAGLVAAYLFFLFIEQQYFRAKLDALFRNPERREEVRGIIDQIDDDVRKYVGMKTLVSAMTALLSWAIMAWVGLDFAAFWALLIFILNYIPNIGSLIATALPALLALVQFDTLQPFAVIAIGVTAIQLFVANVVEPRMMGSSLNLSPLVIILSLVLWGTLWGAPGMFLCVPIMAVAMIVLAHFPQTRPVAVLLSADGKVRLRSASAANTPAE